MSCPRVVSLRILGFSVALLASAANGADAQQSRDARVSVNATVIASATRIAHAELNTVSSRVTAPDEREVQTLVTARSSAESTLSIFPQIAGVQIDIVGADGRVTPLGIMGIRVAQTTAGSEFSAAVRLRLRSANPELLELASRAPVALVVDSAVR
jgi:hypothetical protein